MKLLFIVALIAGCGFAADRVVLVEQFTNSG
jgi:hypothetical protein